MIRKSSKRQHSPFRQDTHWSCNITSSPAITFYHPKTICTCQ